VARRAGRLRRPAPVDLLTLARCLEGSERPEEGRDGPRGHRAASHPRFPPQAGIGMER